MSEPSTHSQGTAHVCITDIDSDALVQLRENVNRNCRDDNNDDDDNNGDIGRVVSCHHHQLIWGKESSENFLLLMAGNQNYDIIIASDIIYSTIIVEPLWEKIKHLLKDKEEEGAVFVMAYERRALPVSIELVLRSAVQHDSW